ncbi:AMP-binding protein [Oenococcus sicerae]|uniref:Acyl-CoA synthetase n=1 Tax=Oenococcus sicerae TaxID=2203724 RepID=A0AAJ1RAW4_9LACO|nr:AMP-binding protein [Oenococcus sicerae]MDN6900425.1 acyl-CoA synthetase [Oenococcus sicerae]
MAEYKSKLIETTFNLMNNNLNQPKLYDADLDIWLNNRQILAAVETACGVLQKKGLAVGDLLLLGLPNSAAYVITYLAAIKSGLDIYSMNPKMPDIQAINEFKKRNYKAAVLSNDYAKLFNDTADKIHTENLTRFHDQVIHLTTWESMDQLEDFEIIPKHAGILMYTSGTTGKAKGVLLDHEQMYIAGENVVQSHKLTDKDRVYIVLPFHHINAQNIAMMSTLISGGSLIVQKHFSAHRFWPIVQRQQATWVSAAPAIISILLNTDINPKTKTNLRFMRSASAPLPAVVMQRFEKRFGLPILNSYGMTEAPSQIAVDPLPPLHSPEGSSGKVFNIAIKISDSTLSHELAAGQDGEVWIKGSGTIKGYLHDRDRGSFVNGWFKTGDIGHLDQNGFIFLVGRSKEMINKSGDKISPYEVENIIDSLDFISGSAVVGYPDPIYGETVAAVILLKEPEKAVDQLTSDAKQIREIVATHKEKFKVPQYIFFMKQVPRGATGKIQRSILKGDLIKNPDLDRY